jgi:RNA polymerase sigma-70 factor (ECF subfamily)
MDEPPAPATRRSLIVKLRDPADTEAWCEFVALYEPLIYRLARRKGLQDADARDLCQEVFRAVARAIDRWDLDPARGSFRGWLARIARNLLVNFLTRRPHRLRGSGSTSVQELLEAQPAADPSATALFEIEYRRRLFRWAADAVRGEFAPTTWQAFWQTAVEGRPPAGVAADLGLSVGAVYIARSRVLARLRHRIGQRDEEAAAIVSEVDHGHPTESL